MKPYHFLLIASLTIPSVGLALQPSFDCNSVKAPADQFICKDNSLIKQDLKLSEIYEKLVKEFPASEIELLRQAQRDWIRLRKNCSKEERKPRYTKNEAIKNCLALQYRIRTGELEEIRKTLPSYFKAHLRKPDKLAKIHSQCDDPQGGYVTMCGDEVLLDLDFSLGDNFTQLDKMHITHSVVMPDLQTICVGSNNQRSCLYSTMRKKMLEVEAIYYAGIAQR